jgi:hypothetical protein
MSERTITLIEKYGLARESELQPTTTIADEIDDYATDTGEGYRAFKVSSTARPVPVLDLVYRDGTSEHFAYSYYYRCRFDPSKQLIIQFTEHEVVIQGYRLHELNLRLQSQRVIRIYEADDHAAKLAGPKDAVVTGITVRERADGSV